MKMKKILSKQNKNKENKSRKERKMSTSEKSYFEREEETEIKLATFIAFYFFGQKHLQHFILEGKKKKV